MGCNSQRHDSDCTRRHSTPQVRASVNPKAAGSMGKRQAKQKLVTEKSSRRGNPQRFVSMTDAQYLWRQWKLIRVYHDGHTVIKTIDEIDAAGGKKRLAEKDNRRSSSETLARF